LAFASSAQSKPIAALTPGVLTIIAGDGTAGYNGDNIPATTAELDFPFGLAVDPAGNVYIADDQYIRKVSTNGIITNFAGNGIQGNSGDGGPATSAELNGPGYVAVDPFGNIYFTELSGIVRKVNTQGIISTVAGVYSGPGGYYGDGGPATQAGLNRPYGLSVDAVGNLYIADTGNNVVRKVTVSTGIITTVAGNGYGSNGAVNDYCGEDGLASIGGYTGDGGPATKAELYGPRSVAFDSTGDIFIADTCNQVIRRVDAKTGIITTFAGNGFGAGNNGKGAFSGDGGPATAAELFLPEAILIDAANDLYIADSVNHRLRFVNPSGIISTIAGNGTTTPALNNVAANATGMHLQGLAFDTARNIYIADAADSEILKINVSQSALNFPSATIPGQIDEIDGYKSVLLTNVGTGTLAIEDTASPNGFTAGTTTPTTCRRSLASGANCELTYAFLPNTNESGNVTGTATITDDSQLNINAQQTIALTGNALSGSGFAFAAFPSGVIDTRPGATTYFLIEVEPYRFSGFINLTVSNAPAGATVAGLPSTVFDPFLGFSVASITFPASTPPGTYTLTITGTSTHPAFTNNASINFNVQ
jgi:sugar lactone lactonase YvrE